MTLEDIREKLAEKIMQQSDWPDALNDSNPGHYGVDSWEVELFHEDIWVDIPKRTFTFKNATFSFECWIGGSSEESGMTMSFTKDAKGSGTFEFSSKGNDVEVEELDLDFDLDLFGD